MSPSLDRPKKYFLEKLRKKSNIKIEAKFACGSNGSTLGIWKTLSEALNRNFRSGFIFFVLYVLQPAPRFRKPLYTLVSLVACVGFFLERTIPSIINIGWSLAGGSGLQGIILFKKKNHSCVKKESFLSKYGESFLVIITIFRKAFLLNKILRNHSSIKYGKDVMVKYLHFFFNSKCWDNSTSPTC